MTPGHRGKAAGAVVLAAGIQATVAQLVTVRELMTRFAGNEFVIAVALFVWLAAGGLGARLAVFGLPAEALRRARGLAADHLKPGGVLSFSVDGYANYIAQVQARKLSILKRTAARCFRHVAVLPGERVFFLCRQDPIPLDIPERLAAKGIPTNYAGPYFYGDIDPGRIAALEAALDPAAPVNTDFNPQLIRVMFAAWFAKFATSPTLFALAATVLAVFCLRRMGAAEYVLWTSGAVVMGSEILVIFAFQVIRGYIYHQLGLIVTAFLAGLMPGALLAARRLARGGRLLMGADAAMILLLAGLAGFLALGGPGRPGIVFAGFGLAFSLAAGLQFPVAVRCGAGGLAAAARAFGATLRPSSGRGPGRRCITVCWPTGAPSAACAPTAASCLPATAAYAGCASTSPARCTPSATATPARCTWIRWEKSRCTIFCPARGLFPWRWPAATCAVSTARTGRFPSPGPMTCAPSSFSPTRPWPQRNNRGPLPSPILTPSPSSSTNTCTTPR